MTMIPLEITETTEQKLERLEQRVTNLEVALHASISHICKFSPYEFEFALNRLLENHFEVSQKLGGFRRTHFDIEG